MAEIERNNDSYFSEEMSDQTVLYSEDNSSTADLALFSFLKIIAKINKYEHMLSYRDDE